MRDFFKSNKQTPMETVHIVLRILSVLLLAVIAYNSSYLKSIFYEMVRSNQEKQFVVNVNNAAPATALPTTQSPTAQQPAQQAQNKNTNAKAASSAKPAPTKNKAQPTTPEANPNPSTLKVEMHNNSPDGAMVFSPPYIQIKAGDSIEFVPSSYGHNVQTPEDIIGNSDAIPANAKPFKGAMNEKLIVKFTEPGIYLYVCNYHYIVGHVGVIQVGNDSHNIDTVKKAGSVLKGKIFSHPDRVDKYLDMVKTY